MRIRDRLARWDGGALAEAGRAGVVRERCLDPRSPGTPYGVARMRRAARWRGVRFALVSGLVATASLVVLAGLLAAPAGALPITA